MTIAKKIINLLKVPLSIWCYKRGILVLPYMPAVLWIEPTNSCNLKCIMCPNSINKNRKVGFMELNSFKAIVNQAESFASKVVLCISGESLLHPDFSKMVEYCHLKRIKTFVSTNATVLTKELSRAIIKSGLNRITFSFDGITKSTYEKVRVNAKFENTLKNIIEFLKIKKQLNAKIITELQILVMDQKGQEEVQNGLSDFVKRFEGLSLDYIQIRKPSTWGGRIKHIKNYEPKLLGREYSPCSYLWSGQFILWDGRVVACCSDFNGEYVLGSLTKFSLKEIWNNQKTVALRKAMTKGNYLKLNKYCKDCDSLWEKSTLGLPSGIRGISAEIISAILGEKLIYTFKKIAGRLNSDFPMKISN